MELTELLSLLDAAGADPVLVTNDKRYGCLSWTVTASHGEITLDVHFFDDLTEETFHETYTMSS